MADSLSLQSPLNTAVVIDPGTTHTCALTSSGGVLCWGKNDYGQLGNYPALGGTGPVTVSGMSSGVKAIATGSDHNCAITSTGAVKCWGHNDYGQLGNGATTNSVVQTPVQVVGLTSGIKAISAAGSHSCALTDAGGVKCWGYNGQGQLGDSTKTSRSTPVDVTGLTGGIASVVAGSNDTCAVTNGGGLKCWGNASNPYPADVTGLSSGVVAVSVGALHRCVLTSAGGVKCWGRNSEGELGNGTNVSAATPADVTGLTSGVKAVASGDGQVCAITVTAKLMCWGTNSSGQVGDGTTANQFTPVEISGLGGRVAAVSAGGAHTCVLFTDGTGKCWGQNLTGQLGDGTYLERVTPADVMGLGSTAISVAVGGNHACAVSTEGAVKCWGENMFGTLGDGTTLNRSSPVDVVGLSGGIKAVSAGIVHSCAITGAGGLKCWGYNLKGQLGDGTTQTRTTPTDVPGLTSGVAAVVVRNYHTCAITTGGGLKCWGQNDNGEIGDGTTTDRLTPTDVVGLTSGVVAVALSEDHACALTGAGGVKCWGQNGNGRLGNGTTSASLTPVDVTGLSSGVAALSAGFFHSCALTTAGAVKCWGGNYYGQLGNGTTTDSSVPVSVSGLTSGVTAIASGQWHTCALTSTGAVKCWGYNDKGELGDGTKANSKSPVAVSGLSSTAATIAAGVESTCAVTISGGVKCWGDDYDGQAGTGRLFYSTTPVTMVGLNAAPVFSISGAVHGSAGPISGATVLLTNSAGQLDQWTTGVDGTFNFPNLAAGSYTLLANKTNYIFAPASIDATFSTADISGLSFTGKYKPASIFGTVTLNSEKAVGVKVSLIDGTNTLSETTTGADGVFTFSSIEPGTYTVLPSYPNYIFTPASRTAVLNGQDVTGMDFVAGYRPASISGIVTGSDGSLTGVTLSLQQAGAALKQTITGTEGVFSFSDLAEGIYTLTPSRQGYVFTPSSQELPLAGADITGIAFTGKYNLFAISGVISGADSPLAEVTVTINNASGQVDQVMTGADGRFHSRDLPAGDYTVVPEKQAHIFTPGSQTVTLVDQNISGVNFAGKYRPASISGTVLTSEGPLAGVVVSLRNAAAPVIERITGSDGTFTFTGLAAGTYKLTITKPEYRFYPTEREVILSGQDLDGLDFNGTYQARFFLPMVAH